MAPACAQAAIRLDAPQLAEAQRRRLEDLRADLSAFGEAVPVPELLPPRGDDFAVGALYTVLGSTLGGKVIHRQLDALLPDDEGRHFFKGHAGDGAHWRLFCDRLENADLDRAQVEAGAAYAFARFQAMLQEEPATT